MNYLPFNWEGPSSLVSELCKPLEKMFLRIYHPAWRGASYVTLWRTDCTGLTICSEMHDVAPRCEVGVLKFAYDQNVEAGAEEIDLRYSFHGKVEVSKLVIEESGTKAESGIILEAGSEKLVVVAGAFPLTLAVGGITPSLPYFEPEYPLDRYARVPLI